MSEEIQFRKYKTRRPDYHYLQVDKKRILSFNAFVYARYKYHTDLVEDFVRESFKKESPVRVLDMGCGDGVLLFMIQKRLADYVLTLDGIDLSPEAIKVARKKMPAGTFHERGVYHSKLPNDYYDVVISSDVIEHVQMPVEMIREAKRVAKPKAFVCISTPVRFTEQPIDTMHVQEFFPQEYQTLMDDLLTDVQIIQTHPLSWRAIYNMAPSFLGKRWPLTRLAINVSSILGVNPFMRKGEHNAYMYAVGRA